MKTSAVIAAAGMSSRMKAYKPMLPLCGSTIIKTVISTLRSGGVDEIVVVTGHNAGMLREHLAQTGVSCLFNDRYQTTDMFCSAKIGLAYMQDRCDRVFFLPGDVPLFSSESLHVMQEYMTRRGCEILLPTHDGKPGHPILIGQHAIAPLLGYQGNGGLKGAIDSFEGAKAAIPLPDAGMTMDADTPEDYDRLKAYARRRWDDTDTNDV